MAQQVQWLTITEEQAGQRIDNFLLKHLKGVPKSRIYRLLRKGEVRVNKKRIGADYRLCALDLLRIPPVYQEDSAKPSPQLHKIQYLTQCILFEDEYVLVLNKPPHIAVHGGSGLSFGVIEGLRALRPQARFLELVHRLDRETSGCLVIAKKSSILKDLHRQLRDKSIKKTYQCLVTGCWPKSIHRIDAPLYKSQTASGERRVRVDEEGKEAVTEFKVMEYGADCTLLEVRPLTGRTHQIRVHTASAKHPIMGDDKYGLKLETADLPKPPRLFLHAASIVFELPDYAAPIQVHAPLPEDLQNFWDEVRAK